MTRSLGTSIAHGEGEWNDGVCFLTQGSDVHKGTQCHNRHVRSTYRQHNLLSPKNCDKLVEKSHKQKS